MALGPFGSGAVDRSALGGGGDNYSPSADELAILGDDPTPPNGSGNLEDPDGEGTDIPPRRGPETDRGHREDPKDDDDREDDDDNVDDDENDGNDDDDAIDDVDDKDDTQDDVDDDKDDDREASPISFKDLKKDYPDIFKKYPDLRSALMHSHAVGQLFPTRKEAEVAAQKAETFDFINERLGRGEAKEFVETMAQNPANFKVFTERYFDTLQKTQPEVYKDIVTPPIKQVVLNSLLEAKAQGNEALYKSAKNMAIYLFGPNWQKVLTEKPEKKEPEPPKEDPEKLELQQKLTKFEKEKQETFVTNVTNVTNKEITKLANSVFRKMDPESKKLSERVRKALMTEARDKVAEKLRANSEYMRQLKSLMEKAKKASFDSGLEPSVTSAYLGRAKNLFPTILQQLIAEELGIRMPKQDKQRRVPQSGNAPRDRKEVAPHPDKVFKGKDAITEEQFLAQ